MEATPRGANGLADKLSGLADALDQAGRANLKLMLGLAAGGLLQAGEPPDRGDDARAYHTTLAAIRGLQPHRAQVPLDGVVYVGRPPFATAELLLALRRESEDRRSVAERFEDHYVASGGPIAQEVGYSTQLAELIQAAVPSVTPTARTNYLYYDEPGLGIDAHVDNEAFSLNAIMMLRHDYLGAPSALVLYPPDQPPRRIFLQPGELVVFYADSITHARERMKQDERVNIVAFGFQALTQGSA